MRKNLLLSGLLALGAIFQAKAATISGSNLPADGYFKNEDNNNASNTFVGAATSTYLGVTANTSATPVEALPWYTVNSGYYLPASSYVAAECPAGSFCAGGTFAYSGTDQGIAVCPANTFSTGGATSACTQCNTNYTTSGVTGATQSAACVKTVSLIKNGGSGTLPNTTQSGTTAGQIVCTQDSACTLPDASSLVQYASSLSSGVNIEAYTFTGGWGEPVSDSQLGSCSNSPQTTLAKGNSVVNMYACKVLKKYAMPLISTVQGESTPLHNYGAVYYTLGDGSTGTSDDRAALWTGSDSNGNITLESVISGNQKLTLPNNISNDLHGTYVLTGFYTQPGGNGVKAIDADGTVQSAWVNNFRQYLHSVSNGENILFANFVIQGVQCPAKQYLDRATLSCTVCPAGFACAGGVFEYDGTQTDQQIGLTACTGTSSYSTGNVASCSSCVAGYNTSENNAIEYHDEASDCTATVTLNKNGGSGSLLDTMENNTSSVGKTCQQGVSCTFPNTGTGNTKLTQPGYVFTGGWGTTADCTGTNRSFNNPTGTYYACKTANKIYIKWYGVQTPGTATTFTADGTNAYKSTVSYDGDIITPQKAVTGAGQSFLGWKFVK